MRWLLKKVVVKYVHVHAWIMLQFLYAGVYK